jgi:hypothetical protein
VVDRLREKLATVPTSGRVGYGTKEARVTAEHSALSNLKQVLSAPKGATDPFLLDVRATCAGATDAFCRPLLSCFISLLLDSVLTMQVRPT